MVNGSRVAVLMQGGVTNKSEFNARVRQGAGLAATMFNIAPEEMVMACNF